CQEFAIRRKCDEGDWPLMTYQSAELLRRGRVPENDLRALAAAGQQLAVGRKRHRADRGFLLLELPEFLAAGDFPEPDRPIPAARGQGLSIGGERDREHPAEVQETRGAETRHGPGGQRIGPSRGVARLLGPQRWSEQDGDRKYIAQQLRHGVPP